MPIYEYFCPACRATYELLRPMSRSDEAGVCPRGHGGGARVVSAFATITAGASGERPPAAGGGCACGGACACGGH